THPLAEIVPACDFADVPFSDIAITGSTAVAPLALQMAAQARAGGYPDMVTVASTTTGAGFATFCADGGGDVVAASRAANGDERERCRAAGRSLLPFPIAVDALTIAVSRENLFLQSVTIQELQQIVVYARTWSDLNPQWPNDPILRALPGMQSGTAAYFVEAVMEEEALAQLAERRNQPLSSLPEVSATNDQRDTTMRPTVGNVVGTTVFIDKSPRVRIGYVEEGGEEGEARGPACAFVTEAMGLILAENFGLQVELRAFPDADELFATLAAKTPEARVDLTFCYLDPLDRSYRQRYFGYTEFIDSGYRQIGENRLVIMTNSVVKPALERENRCLYQFLDALSLEGMPLSGQTPSDWYVQNQATIDAWLPCE
ncbi:MAG: substrate-binding domain-containing protein, partial [Caldilineaceae bacterium]|nr:substrate-binding domain-containing protein [Caldilineaceae bacterium]